MTEPPQAHVQHLMASLPGARDDSWYLDNQRRVFQTDADDCDAAALVCAVMGGVAIAVEDGRQRRLYMDTLTSLRLSDGHPPPFRSFPVPCDVNDAALFHLLGIADDKPWDDDAWSLDTQLHQWQWQCRRQCSW